MQKKRVIRALALLMALVMTFGSSNLAYAMQLPTENEESLQQETVDMEELLEVDLTEEQDTAAEVEALPESSGELLEEVKAVEETEVSETDVASGEIQDAEESEEVVEGIEESQLEQRLIYEEEEEALPQPSVNIAGESTTYKEICFLDEKNRKIEKFSLHIGESKEIRIGYVKKKDGSTVPMKDLLEEGLEAISWGSQWGGDQDWILTICEDGWKETVFLKNGKYLEYPFTEVDDFIFHYRRIFKGVQALSGYLTVRVHDANNFGGQIELNIPIEVLPAEEGKNYREVESNQLPKILQSEAENYAYIRQKMLERDSSNILYITKDEFDYGRNFDFNSGVLDFYEEREDMRPYEGDYLHHAQGNRDSYITNGAPFYYIGMFEYKNTWGSACGAMLPMITTKGEEEQVDQKIQELLGEGGALHSVNNAKASDEAKIKAIYNYITGHVSGTVPGDRRTPIYHTAYHALIKGSGTCEAFALLFTRLSRELGIPSKVIMGKDSANHAYNIVQVRNYKDGDDWYFIDCSAKIYLTDNSFKRYTEQDQFRDERFSINYLSKVKGAPKNENVKITNQDNGDSIGFQYWIQAKKYIQEDIQKNPSRHYTVTLNERFDLSGDYLDFGENAANVSVDLNGQTLDLVSEEGDNIVNVSEIANGKIIIHQGGRYVFGDVNSSSDVKQNIRGINFVFEKNPYFGLPTFFDLQSVKNIDKTTTFKDFASVNLECWTDDCHIYADMKVGDAEIGGKTYLHGKTEIVNKLWLDNTLVAYNLVTQCVSVDPMVRERGDCAIISAGQVSIEKEITELSQWESEDSDYGFAFGIMRDHDMSGQYVNSGRLNLKGVINTYPPNSGILPFKIVPVDNRDGVLTIDEAGFEPGQLNVNINGLYFYNENGSKTAFTESNFKDLIQIPVKEDYALRYTNGLLQVVAPSIQVTYREKSTDPIPGTINDNDTYISMEDLAANIKNVAASATGVYRLTFIENVPMISNVTLPAFMTEVEFTSANKNGGSLAHSLNLNGKTLTTNGKVVLDDQLRIVDSTKQGTWKIGSLSLQGEEISLPQISVAKETGIVGNTIVKLEDAATFTGNIQVSGNQPAKLYLTEKNGVLVPLSIKGEVKTETEDISPCILFGKYQGGLVPFENGDKVAAIEKAADVVPTGKFGIVEDSKPSIDSGNTISLKRFGKELLCEERIKLQDLELVRETLSDTPKNVRAGESFRLYCKMIPSTTKPDDIKWQVENGDEYVSLQALPGLDYCMITVSKDIDADATAQIKVTADEKTAIYNLNVKPNKIILSLNGGSYEGKIEDITVEKIGYGDSLGTALVTPKKEGNVFLGWFTTQEGAGKQIFADTEITTEEVLYARYSPAKDEQAQNLLQMVPVPDMTYTGKAQKPKVQVYYGETLLTEKVDYTLSYKNNTNAWIKDDANYNQDKDSKGAYKKAPTIIITGKGNYSGKYTLEFNILPLDIKTDSFDAENIVLAYTGKLQKPVPKLLWNGKALKAKTAFTYTYPDELTGFSKLGLYTITLQGVGNYQGTREVKVQMTTGVMASKFAVDKISPYEYKGTACEPKPQVSYNKKPLIEGEDYNIAYLNNNAVGTATVVITGKGEYAGTKKVTFKITGKKIKDAIFTPNKLEQETFSGVEIKKAIVLQSGDTPLVENKDYKVTYTNNKNSGTAKMSVIGMGEYAGTSVTKSFSIKPYNITENPENRENRISVEYETEVDYLQSGAKPNVVVKFHQADGKDTVLQEGVDYTLSYAGNKAITKEDEAPKATVTIKGKKNFTGTIVKTYRIKKADLSEMYAFAEDIVARPNLRNVTCTVTVKDRDMKALKNGKDYTLTYNGNLTELQPGKSITVTVKAVDNGNYTGTKTVTCRMIASDKDISRAVIVCNKNLVYAGEKIELTENDLVVTLDGQTLSTEQYKIEIESIVYPKGYGKGTMTVVIRGIKDYGGKQQKKITVAAKSMQEM